MSRSMTGFGRGEAGAQGKKFTVELKSVNHRFAEVVLRMPRSIMSLEEKVKRQVQGKVARGRVDGFITMEDIGEKTSVVKVDKELSLSYYRAMKEMMEELGISPQIKPEHLLSLPGIFSLEEPQENCEDWWPALEEAVLKALDSLVDMRQVEGDRLKEDILQRLAIIKEKTKAIESRSPLVVEDYRQRLSVRLQEWAADSSLDTNRLMAEVAIFADRSSITEEVVRLYSHVGQFQVSLETVGAIGRKLDFILQEMNREINTIGSKASDLEISSAVVDVKSELEKIREQIQNIE